MAIKKNRKTSKSRKRFGKSYKFRKKGRGTILKNKFFWLFVSVFILFGGVFYLASFARFFQVEGSEIQGNGKVSSAGLEDILKKEVEKKILFFPTKSIFFANLEKAKEKIEKEFPQVAKVKIIRNFPNKIIIQIEEKQPVAIFCESDLSEKCFLIDEEGEIIDYVVMINSENLKLPKIIGGEVKRSELGSKVIENFHLAFVSGVHNELTEGDQLSIKEFIPSQKKLTAITSDGWQIFFDPFGDISDQVLNLTVLLKEKIPPENRGNLNYIDLRFGSKVYFKYR